MNIVIVETGAKETLELIDRNNGTNCVVDVIGNYDGLGSGDYQFAYDEETGTYACTQETYDWWAKVIADQAGLADRIAELSGEHGKEAVSDVVNSASDVDLEDQAAAVIAALDEAFGSRI
ncbi:hypothetical protein M6D81_11705 [Paenibacillus sp. J5C_2022]|uniref:hypothetical protein n=1 Tax=Paenibacillus sp. J5C2022 TaxID=2977129 RepID=UPI0021D13619|nr:hypothetical protein [Paenibacillus sp. J5C2022]MCU6709373.1 hypothetical protein [Paenibacillus sp. J5C2022]